MAKRLRRPKLKDGELRVYWGKPDPGDMPDVVFAWQGDSSMRADTRLLYFHLGCERPDPSAKPLWSKVIPSLLKELEARGYDLTTLKFSILKKAASKEPKQ